MTLEVARWATQLSLSGNMIKQKTYKFYVNNQKIKVLIRATQFSTMGGPVGDPWI